MTNPFTPLSEEEFDELDQFLLYDVDMLAPTEN